MSWILAFLGFSALILLHEVGHFVAAKAVGMKVEKFSLFFGKPIVSFTRGETEYAIGRIPLGGYVKITGMDPRAELSEEDRKRAYYTQKVWKRIVVILAGPVVNLVLAVVILSIVYASSGVPAAGPVVDRLKTDSPAAKVLRTGDVIVSVDGAKGADESLNLKNSGDRLLGIAKAVGKHSCEPGKKESCLATTPAKVVFERDGKRSTASITPFRYPAGTKFGDAKSGADADALTKSRTLLGITYGTYRYNEPVGSSLKYAGEQLWFVTKESVKTIGKLIYSAEARENVSGPVGSYETTRQAFEISTTLAFTILAFISLSLGILNLLPILPLDGGHIFWAIVEKIRGSQVPFKWTEYGTMVGFVLVMMLFALGLYNDVGRLAGEGFAVK